MTFKADNDDTRNSLSFKLKKQLDNGAYDVVCVDPYVPGVPGPVGPAGRRLLPVLMTPHADFADLGGRSPGGDREPGMRGDRHLGLLAGDALPLRATVTPATRRSRG